MPKTAMFVKAKIDGAERPILLNVDTGAEVSFLDQNRIYSNPDLDEVFKNQPHVAVPDGYPFSAGYGYIVKGEIANTPFSGKAFLLHTAAPADGSRMLGVVGLGAFSKPVMTIDFIGNRIAITETSSEVEQALSLSFHFDDLLDVNGLPALQIFSKGEAVGKFVVDTGSSEQGIVIFSEKKWSEVTGSSIDDPKNLTKNVVSLGRKFYCTIAPSISDFGSNHISLGNLPVEFCYRDGKPMSEDGIDGLIGNVAFIDKAIVIFDTKEKKIGVAFH